MPFSSEERLQFMKWMTDLGPDCDRSQVLRWVTANTKTTLEELVATPGHEQVRTGILRLMADFVTDRKERDRILPAVGKAITMPVSADAKQSEGMFTRHPAWIGLSVMEFCDLTQREDGGLDWAVELAGQAFVIQGGSLDVGRGEVLWAMAEQAEEVGWFDRVNFLLKEARKGPFQLPEHEWQVTLLVAMRKLEREESAGESLIDSLLEAEEADEQTFVHAVWIKAHLLRERGLEKEAKSWIQRALEALDDEASVQVKQRLHSFLNESPA